MTLAVGEEVGILAGVGLAIESTLQFSLTANTS